MNNDNKIKINLELLESIVDSIPSPIFVKNKNHEFIIVNELFCELIAKSRNEIIGKNDYDFFPKYQADIFREKDKIVFRTREMDINEEDLDDAAGIRRTIITTKIVKEIQGELILVGTIQDVTELKEKEKEVSRIKKIFESVMENAPLGIFVKDVKKEFEFIHWNSFMENYFHLLKEKVIGKTDFDVFEKDKAEFFRETDLEMIKDKIEFTTEGIQSLAEGFFFQTKKVLISDRNGQPSLIAGFVQDMTDIVNSEKEIRDKNMLLAQSTKDTALGQMAGSIAHEINNPLMIILNGCKKISKYLKEKSIEDEGILKTSESVTSNVFRITNIVKSLLTIGKDIPDEYREDVKLELIVNDVLGVCAEKFKSFGISFSCDRVPTVEINCNRVLISQILLNLVQNAFYEAKNHKENGFVKIGFKVFPHQLKISVTDSGEGIPNQIVDRMFDPFFSTKEIGVGTGLGLAISRKIALEHNGSLSYDYTSSNTSFILELPIKKDHSIF